MRDVVDGIGRSGAGAQTLPQGPADAGGESTAVDLAAVLRDVTANLAAFIEQRAEEIAAPRIAAVQEAADARVAEVEGERDAVEQRLSAVVEELRRQVEFRERRIADFAWVARYLPYRLRLFVLAGDRRRHPFDKPKESFAEAVDQVAAELGLTPYATE